MGERIAVPEEHLQAIASAAAFLHGAREQELYEPLKSAFEYLTHQTAQAEHGSAADVFLRRASLLIGYLRADDTKQRAKACDDLLRACESFAARPAQPAEAEPHASMCRCLPCLSMRGEQPTECELTAMRLSRDIQEIMGGEAELAEAAMRERRAAAAGASALSGVHYSAQAHPSPDTEQSYTDGGRNMFYEGLFEGETRDDQQRRIAGAKALEMAEAAADTEHPEDRCQHCGGANVVWFVDNATWNRVMPNDGIVCPTCFARRADELGEDVTRWELRADTRDTVQHTEQQRRAAVRYQWLRVDPRGRHTINGGIPWPVVVEMRSGMPSMIACFEENLDHAIDAAIETEGQS